MRGRLSACLVPACCVYVCVCVCGDNVRGAFRFPQQIIIAFTNEVEMDKIKTVTTNVRKLQVCAVLCVLFAWCCIFFRVTPYVCMYVCIHVSMHVCMYVCAATNKRKSNVKCHCEQFEACTQTSPTEFQEIYDVEVADRNGRVQAETNQVIITHYTRALSLLFSRVLPLSLARSLSHKCIQ